MSQADLKRLFNRIKNILLQPAQEWDAVRDENLTATELFTTYLVVIAAVPAVAGFIGSTVVGIPASFIGTVRPNVFRALSAAAVGYACSLAGVYLAALVVDKLAPAFKSTSNMTHALKLVGFTSLPVWAAGVVHILPMFSPLVVLVALYAIYIFYLGLPKLMGTPADKVVPYMIVSAAVLILVGSIIVWVEIACRGI
ncbi:MAG: YIP1 family protein [Verrucomicrobia bacterium]|nr:YIP1 family protein [Verrucomicrobiota bacterium]